MPREKWSDVNRPGCPIRKMAGENALCITLPGSSSRLACLREQASVRTSDVRYRPFQLATAGWPIDCEPKGRLDLASGQERPRRCAGPITSP